MPTTSRVTGLTKVQNLYLMQIELWKVIDSDLKNPDEVKEAKKTLKEFTELLKEVDWKYMGGEDVIDALECIRLEAAAKLKATSMTKKTTAKKAVAKKKAVKKKTK